MLKKALTVSKVEGFLCCLQSKIGVTVKLNHLTVSLKTFKSATTELIAKTEVECRTNKLIEVRKKK